MALTVRNVDILTQGEFVALARSMKEGELAGVFTDLWAGDPVSPRTLCRALEKASLQVADEHGHEIIALAMRRLKDAFADHLLTPCADLPGPEESEI